jgi:hypothetical protein
MGSEEESRDPKPSSHPLAQMCPACGNVYPLIPPSAALPCTHRLCGACVLKFATEAAPPAKKQGGGGAKGRESSGGGGGTAGFDCPTSGCGKHVPGSVAALPVDTVTPRQQQTWRERTRRGGGVVNPLCRDCDDPPTRWCDDCAKLCCNDCHFTKGVWKTLRARAGCGAPRFKQHHTTPCGVLATSTPIRHYALWDLRSGVLPPMRSRAPP